MSRSGWRNNPPWRRHAMFLAAHMLIAVLAGVYLYECLSIIRAGL
jgi:hypothetical protein